MRGGGEAKGGSKESKDVQRVHRNYLPKSYRFFKPGGTCNFLTRRVRILSSLNFLKKHQTQCSKTRRTCRCECRLVPYARSSLAASRTPLRPGRKNPPLTGPLGSTSSRQDLMRSPFKKLERRRSFLLTTNTNRGETVADLNRFRREWYLRLV